MEKIGKSWRRWEKIMILGHPVLRSTAGPGLGESSQCGAARGSTQLHWGFHNLGSFPNGTIFPCCPQHQEWPIFNNNTLWP